MFILEQRRPRLSASRGFSHTFSGQPARREALVWTQTRCSGHSPCSCPQGAHILHRAGTLALRLCQPRTARFLHGDSVRLCPRGSGKSQPHRCPRRSSPVSQRKEMSDQLRIGRTLRDHLRLRKVEISGLESESKSPWLLLDLFWSPKTVLHRWG